MQYPHFPRSGNQSSAGVPNGGYSVFQPNNIAADAQLNSVSKPLDSATFSQQPQKVYQGETHNFSDQAATTWHWRSNSKNFNTALPIQEAPTAQRVPANARSFAPPVNLGQLQRVNRPQNQHQYSADIYKSPIDRPYAGKARKQVKQLNLSDQANGALEKETPYSTEQSEHASATPQRDPVTEAKEFLPREAITDTLFDEAPQQEPAASYGKQVIVLRSQSPEELAKVRTKEASPSLPDAQLLTPNFESYVGSPALDTEQDAYQDGTQWKVYTPKQEVVDLPPPAIFESLPEKSFQTPAVKEKSFQPPAVKYSQPEAKDYAFEAAEEVSALPEPPPAPAPKVEKDLFRPALSATSANDIFGTTSSKVDTAWQVKKADTAWQVKKPVKTKTTETNHRKDTPVSQVSVAKVASTNLGSSQPAYRFERYETSGDVEANTTAATVAYTKPVAQPVATESAWLSPWWMLVCLIPFGMFLLFRRGSEVGDYSYEYDEVEDRPRLPQEMIERPGYSKSDAVYGETDEYFATEKVFTRSQSESIAEQVPMAAPLVAASITEESEEMYDDLDDILPAETASAISAPAVQFANSNLVQTNTELDGDVSPNFRLQRPNTCDAENDEGQICNQDFAETINAEEDRHKFR